MGRFGDALVASGKITPAQLEAALRAQVLWGGRLGTNLIELGFLELEDLTRALAAFTGLAPALAQHFEVADAVLQQRLSPALAGEALVVPLGDVAGASDRIAIAVASPLDDATLAAVALELAVRPENLLQAIAAELRLRYQLERIYRIDRDARFLRIKKGITREIPVPLVFEDSEPEAPLPVPTRAPRVTKSPVAAEILEFEISVELGDEVAASSSSSDDLAGVAPQVPVFDEGSERRRYVPTLRDAPLPQTLGRIAIAKRRVGAGISPTEEHDAETLGEQLRRIRRSHDRDHCGGLAIDALDRFGGAALEAAGLWVLRGGLAIWWRGYTRHSNVGPSAIAVPLDEPSLMRSALEAGLPDRVRLNDSTPLTEIDRRLLERLGGAGLEYVCTAPVSIGTMVSILVYGHGRGDVDAASMLVAEVAQAMQIGFSRLLRAAQR